jgi:hypothetical protein
MKMREMPRLEQTQGQVVPFPGAKSGGNALPPGYPVADRAAIDLVGCAKAGAKVGFFVENDENVSLRIVYRGVHACMARRFLHLLELSFLLIELLLDLRRALQLTRRIAVVRTLILRTPASGANG